MTVIPINGGTLSQPAPQGIVLPPVVFEPFPKIPRLFRDMVITEKIDGSNAAVIVTADGVYAQSRKRIITPGKSTDNFGFAAWVRDHEEELRELGPGHHFGEWYGLGIQRGYGLDHRRFALFNVHKWHVDNPPPECCEVVPVLNRYTFDGLLIRHALNELRKHGSVAAIGYPDPEGVCVFHTAAGQLFKVLIEGDEVAKSQLDVIAQEQRAA